MGALKPNNKLTLKNLLPNPKTRMLPPPLCSAI